MNTLRRRLIGLNLAILILLSVVIPAAAMTQVNISESMSSSYVPPTFIETVYFSNIAGVSTSDEPFYIIVGDTGFDSVSDQSGDGWRYRAANKCLELNNYQGGAIQSNGDLTIYTKGTVSITGASKAYAENAITVTGSLTLFAGGSLTVTGGNGNSQAGNGIAASGTIKLYANDSTVSVFGGNALSNRVQGGHALRGKQIYLSGKEVNAVGGNGFESSAGCGIYADTVKVEANGSFQGGTGSVDAAGIYFFSTCHFGVIDAQITGGSASASPIWTGTPPGSVYLNPHTKFTQSALNQYPIRIKLYELLLHGNQGFTDDGATFTSLQNYYPTCYDLLEYPFHRDGYVQMGWTEHTITGDWVPLNTLYCPVTDTDLHAYWVRADVGDILLNGLHGTFADSSHYKKYSDTPVMLPDELSYPDTSLLAWGSTLTEADNERYLFSGVWYTGGDTVQSDPDAATVLYSKTADGTYALYHPTLGTIKTGGTVVLQGITATSSDLITYTPDASILTAPDGYQLAGWSTCEGGEVTYTPGASITIPSRDIVHLYAVWEKKSIEYVPEPGVRIVYTPEEHLLQMVLSDAWCADNGAAQGILAMYDDTAAGRQMIGCSIWQYQAGQDLILELDYDGSFFAHFSIFAVDQNFAPCTGSIFFDAAELI